MSKTHKENHPDALDHTGITDPVAFGRTMLEVAERSRPLWEQFFETLDLSAEELAKDPMNLRGAYLEFLQKLMEDPEKLVQYQMTFWTEWMTLWSQSAKRFIDGEGEDIYKPAQDDRRFRSAAWNESAYFDFLKQSYLMTTTWAHKMISETGGLDDNTRKKVSFYADQFLNALSPSNYPFTNPDVMRETIETKGDNLIRGLKNLIEDMERGKGQLDISTTDYKAFKLGENIATTPGKIVYQNDLMQLIQYEPVTAEVFKTPLLIVPPWINKYYILDLRPDNSFIKWLTEQGHTVFVISWVNPDKKLAEKRFEDYLTEGLITALDKIKDMTGEKSCNTIGYCLGGTLLSIGLAYLKANKQEDRIESATLLTTLIDFKEAGDLKLFLDEAQISLMDKEMAEKGFLPASQLRKTFSALRANDMIWTFVVNNYLLGREPFPFDLLYWNDDSTNMPAAMHSFYMRKCYLENKLVEPGGVVMNDTPIDMAAVETPTYFLSTKEDHIAPWKAIYQGTKRLKGPVTFTLAASGHVAGVINPPAAKKYCFWTSKKHAENAENWLAGAAETGGSWWPHWQKWVKKYAGDKTKARNPGCGKLKPLEDAPGSYVKKKA